MKKTTQSLLTVFIVLLLLVLVTASPRARSNPNPTPPVQYYGHGLQIRWRKEMGLIPVSPGSAQASTTACSAFFIYAVDPADDKVIGYSTFSVSQQPTEQEGYYVCEFRNLKGPETKAVFVLPGMGDVDLLPKMSRQSYYWTDQWIGGTNSRPPADWIRSLNRSRNANISSVFDQFEMVYVRGDNPNPTLDSSSEKGASPILRASSFAGVWHAKLGEGALELILQQAGKQVTGQVKINSADVGIIRDGIVSGNTLRFKIVRAGKSLFNGLTSPDEFVSTGELVMDEGGTSFTGNVLGTATSGTFVGR
jgi:hypothetical protein